jgi:hypothetical protein
LRLFCRPELLLAQHVPDRSVKGIASGVAGEGPVGLVICPSRELARQTLQVMDEYVAALREDGYPELRTLLCIGGVDMRAQVGFSSVFLLLQTLPDNPCGLSTKYSMPLKRLMLGIKIGVDMV